MATITASLERSLQNCSLNQTTKNRRGRISSSDASEIINHHHQQINNTRVSSSSSSTTITKEESVTASSSDNNNSNNNNSNSSFVELNSHVSLPYHWEQCLDLKTGEIYYINWSNGMKAKEDPRTTATGYNGDYYSEDEEEEEDEDDEESNYYDSEGSSSESSSCSSNRKENHNFRSIKKHQQQQLKQDSVLVVAGCKSCLMYYMVPKHVEDCPKCSGQLLHFAANNNNSSP